MLTARLILPALAAGVLLASGCASPSNPELGQEEFRQARREAALKARIDTLEARLNDERLEVVRAENRADALQRDLLREKNFRQFERVQYELALRQNEDLKKKLDQMRGEDDELRSMREQVIQLNEAVKQRDAELARLQAQLTRLQQTRGRGPS